MIDDSLRHTWKIHACRGIVTPVRHGWISPLAMRRTASANQQPGPESGRTGGNTVSTTPRPWIIDKSQPTQLSIMSRDDEDGIAVCEMWGINQLENAILLVRAVNTLDEAQEALILAHRMLLQTDWAMEDGALNEIEAVLAKLKGGAE